jgi:hypothetical protein
VDDATRATKDASSRELESKATVAGHAIPPEKLQRLIDWNVELFEELLKPIVQRKRV